MVAHKEALPEDTINTERKRNADNLKQCQDFRGQEIKMPSASKIALKKSKNSSKKERGRGCWRIGLAVVKHRLFV